MQRLCICCTELCLVTKFLVANAGLFWTGELEPFIFGTATINHRASTALPLAPQESLSILVALMPTFVSLLFFHIMNVE